MHVRTHAALSLSLSSVPSSEAIYKHVPPRTPRGRKKTRITKICSIFLRSQCYFLARAWLSTVINNRAIHRARSNASLATLSGIISSGLIAHYYFDVRQESTRWWNEREREKVRERKSDPISRNTSRDCIRETMRNVIVNYEHLKRNGVRGEERRDEWCGNRKKSRRVVKAYN